MQGKPTGARLPQSIYSEIIAEKICDRLMNGESLKKICRTEGYPAPGTVMAWVNHPSEADRPGFTEKFIRSRDLGYHLMADEIIEISDNSTGDKKTKWINGKEIEYVDFENIQRDRLRVDTRKFIISKTLPKIYGDKVQHTHDVNINLVDRMAAARKRLATHQAERLASQIVIEGTAEEV